MAYLGNAPARSFISFERQVFTIVNSQTAYTLSHSVTNENDLRLVINNIVQEPGSGKAYTASGTTLTLSAALVNGTDEMYCVFLGRATATNAPAAGSVNTAAITDLNVTTAKIAADAITEAKIADDAVESEHLNNNVISGQTELAAEPDDTDEFLVSDAGTIKRIDYSYIKGGLNTPAFQMNRGDNTQQTISNNTGTVVEFSGEEFDIGSCADPSNNKFICPSGEGGKYYFYFRIGYSNPNTSGHRILYIQRANSGGSFSAIKELQDNGAMFGAAAATAWTGSAILDIDAGQEVRLEIYQGSGGNLSTNPVSGQNLYFGGFKLAGTT